MAIKHIMVPFEPSPVSYKAFRTALGIAKENKAKVSVIMVFKNDYYAYATGSYAIIPLVTERLEVWQVSKEFDKLIKEAKSSKVKFFADITFSSSVEKGIVEFAKKNKVDLIVMGNRGRKGWTKTLLGSISEKVERKKPPCSLLIVN